MLLANNVNIIEDTGIVTQYTYTGSTSVLPTFFGKTESECGFTGTFTVVSN